MFFRSFIITLALVLSSSVSFAFEGRHEIDPTVSLDALRAKAGKPMISKRTVNGRIFVDSSAILTQVSVDKLLTKSLQFDQYVQMGMPHLRASRIVAESPAENLIYVWSHMVLSAMGMPFSSKHFLRVHKLPTGSEWELTPKMSNWPAPEDSALQRLDGSWFVRELGANEVYVRYWLAMESNVSPAIVDLVAGSQLQRGVGKVIEVLAREAAL